MRNEKIFKKIPRIMGKVLIYSLKGFLAYATVCVGANFSISLFKGKKLSEIQAKNAIQLEQRNFYLKDKKINFIPLENNPLSKGTVEGFSYSSEGEFYIAQDREFVYKRVLMHELGHFILSNPQKEKITLEDCLEEAKYYGNPKMNADTIKRLAKYTLSPRELFCNIYALTRN